MRKKKNQRKWENSEEYNNSKKEKEYLSKYKNIARDYLEDWEFIDIFKKNNYDDELISKELNKIILGDEFKWKEIKNGKPVTTRSTDQIRKKKNYYRPEKSYPSYDKSEEESNNEQSNNNKRKGKGSYNKYYINKRPKRPFTKCIEVPSDYHPQNNNQENKNIVSDSDNVINEDKKNNNQDNINNENSEKENLNPKDNNENFEEKNKINIKKNYLTNKKEEKKNEENILPDEEQNRLKLIKGKVFNSLKRIKTNTDIKKKENIQNIEIYKAKRINEDNNSNNKAPGPEIHLNQDNKNNNKLRKYFRELVGNIKHYPKKNENNIKRANSKDSETSDDKSPETIKRKKRNNIPTSSNIIQKKKIIINNNNGINRTLRKTYEIDRNSIEFESKVANVSVNSCYENPYRDQYLKIINEKRKQNPGKIVEFIIPQFNTPFMPPYPSPYQFNPYANQNMYMYPQYQMPNNIGIPQINHQINPQMNMNYPPQINIPLNHQQYSPQSTLSQNKQINSPNNSPLNSQINVQLSPQVNQQINHNNYIGMNDPRLLSPQSNNAPNPEPLVNNNLNIIS